MTEREAAERIVRAAVIAADPEAAVRDALQAEPGADGRVWIVGAGKAACAMGLGAAAALGERVAGGVLVTVDGAARPVPGLEVWEAAHPLPDARGLAAAAETMRLLHGAGGDDLVLCLLSGGASALWSAPPDGVTLDDLRAIGVALLRSGAPIAEVNTVRRHLSLLAGGRLARLAAPARVLTLAVSDVVGAAPEAIGSGPTLPDPTTYADALAVHRERASAAPPAALHHLQGGAEEEAPEPGPGIGNAIGFRVVLSVRDALAGAAEAASQLGYAPRVVDAQLSGEAREAGAEIAAAALRARDSGEGPVALLWGGETTVTVRGGGRGGRCQELALAAALVLEDQPGVVIAALATDGVDGPDGAAGAVVDGGTVGRAGAAGLDPDAALAENDSRPVLAAAGDLVTTGPTGTNVNDVVVALVGRPTPPPTS
ncbi:MAG TPA: DUF4147 domain-containing protein [Longimicrobiaceae bacterium]|nr:DUF4147 domain-containing protein [Longimicrobiaceae bacterium]